MPCDVERAIFIKLFLPISLSYEDEGGALMALTYEDEMPYVFQAGISSHGPKICDGSGHPRVYTRISSFLEWIAENIDN